MFIDHIEWAVTDLEQSAQAFCETTGLGLSPGGQHPDWGTANLVVPLGRGYLEFITVEDPDVAATVGIGRSVAAQMRRGGGIAGWGVSVDDLDAVARRLGLEVVSGHRCRPDGTTLRWRMAGLEEAFERALPFFMSWDAGGDPSQAAAEHAVAPTGFRWIEVANDREELDAWLGHHDLDVRPVVGSTPGPVRAAIGTAAGDVVFPM